MPWPLDRWWFWIFVAPELVLMAGWLVFMVFAGLGYGAAWGWRKAFRRRDR